jgi:hypothetical protein
MTRGPDDGECAAVAGQRWPDRVTPGGRVLESPAAFMEL